MNGRFEERLARLAFGDMSPEEAAELERKAAADPEAARILSEFRAMRTNLRDLSEAMPPDQLSKERLRDAILAQGLRPMPEAEPSSKGWIWMPVLAGALAFAVFALRPTPHTSTPTLVMNSQMDRPIEAPSIDVDLKSLRSKPVAVKKAPPVSKPAAIVASEPVRVRRSHRDTDLMAVATTIDTESDGPSGPILVGEPTSSRHSERSRGESAMSPKPDTVATVIPVVDSHASSGPIVLIDGVRDSETGANNATEVGTASNVLVGG